ncbi:MAG: 4Fe-4S dicluster domain-containing protein [Phycisphaerae bacterium]|nr:4Fe-4S dicluster domain-containing protein [Phycisphaerae bacterium]
MTHRYGIFTGGIDIPDEKQATLDEPIRAVSEIEVLRVPLAPCGGAAAEAVVEPGQSVRAGERLARAGQDGVDVFAPLAGQVRDVVSVVTAIGRQLMRMPAIELTELSGCREIPDGEETFDWIHADAEELRRRIDESHLVTQRRRPLPLTRWVQRAHRAACEVFVVNAVESQPYITADHRLLVEHGEEVMRGVSILARAVGARRCILAVDQRRTRDYDPLLAPAEYYEVEHAALPPKYPIGSDHILLKVLTRREVPCGGNTLDIGAAVIDPASCFAAYHWVARGRRLGGRLVTISGEHVTRPANLFVPFGTDARSLLPTSPPPYVMGGPMVGTLCEGDAVTGPAVNALLAIDPTPTGSASQCIRCGWCRDHCPTRLNVAVLNDLYELSRVESAELLGALSCVECGVCSYVCPARLPLTRRVRELKRAIRRLRHTPAPRREGEPHHHPETT